MQFLVRQESEPTLRRERLRRGVRELGHAGLALFALITIAWSISVSKHSGSFDANLAIRDPGDYLSRIRLKIDDPDRLPDLPRAGAELYLVYSDERVLIVWDRSERNLSGDMRTFVVLRDSVEWMEVRRSFRVQPGNRFL